MNTKERLPMDMLIDTKTLATVIDASPQFVSRQILAGERAGRFTAQKIIGKGRLKHVDHLAFAAFLREQRYTDAAQRLELL